MRKIFFGVLLFIITLFILLIFNKNEFLKKPSDLISPSIKKENISFQNYQSSTITRQLFVPYWVEFKDKIDTKDYEKIIYFGLTPDENGISREDQGFKNLPVFLQDTDSGKERLLGVRMINQDLNEKILHDKNLQQKTATDITEIADKNKFEGVVLDFEFSALNFDQVVHSITNLINTFGSKVHGANLKFYVTAYGDDFYRARPLDIEEIANSSDGIYIMAYDFHKAKGNPGPNFPLNKGEDEDYDFKQMLNDFLLKVPAKKITIIFGMFGYNWTVGDKGNSLKEAIPISLNDASQNLINNCKFQNCKKNIDPVSKEVEVKYLDKDGMNHDVWVETLDSVEIKKQFLESRNITNTAFWAYSYF